MPPVLDQGSLGSCVSNAASLALHFCLKKEKVSDFVPDRLFIYYNGRIQAGYGADVDSGLQLRDAAKSISTFSTCDETLWPYDVTKFSEKPPQNAYDNANLHKKLLYQAVNPDLTSLKAALSEGYPIIFGVTVYDSFMTSDVASTGMIPMPDVQNENVVGGHALTLIGYDDSTQLFQFQNSWGAGWGIQGGRAYIPYSYITGVDSTGTALASDYWTYSLYD